MSSQTKILVTGATGYIGGSVLFRLLKHPNMKSFDITVFVRSAEKAAKFKDFGVRAVVGSYADLDKLTQASSEADVVFEIADADNAAAAAALLAGMKLRYQQTGVPPILIHTSGTGVLTDDAQGQHGDHTIYDDLDVQQIASLPESAPHRNVDLLIQAADDEGYIKSYLNLPGGIWGIVKNELTEAGIQRAHGIQIPYLVRASIKRKRGGMLGQGKNLWAGVSNEDTANFIILLFDKATSDPSTPHGREGYYFVEANEFPLHIIGKGIAEALVFYGVTDNNEAYGFTKEESDEYFGDFWYILAGNSRARGNRARSLGWKPVEGTAEMLATIRPEVEAQLKELGLA